MTNWQSASTDEAAPPAESQRTGSGISVFLFVLAGLSLLWGVMVFLGTESRGYFERAPMQAGIGTAFITVGLLALFSALILAGVNGMVRRQTRALLAAQQAQAAELAQLVAATHCRCED